jgi:hypothetical protein
MVLMKYFMICMNDIGFKEKKSRGKNLIFNQYLYLLGKVNMLCKVESRA